MQQLKLMLASVEARKNDNSIVERKTQYLSEEEQKKKLHEASAVDLKDLKDPEKRFR